VHERTVAGVAEVFASVSKGGGESRLVGHSEPGRPVLTFASDTCIAECTDDEGNPVPDGVPSSKVLVTNLHNLTQARRFIPLHIRPAGIP